jgi:hypothetical protein
MPKNGLGRELRIARPWAQIPPNCVIEILNITTSYHFIIHPKLARKIGGREP